MNTEVVFFGRFTGATGAYVAAAGSGLGTVPNPICSNQASAVGANTGAGVNTVTFATAMPLGEYLYEAGIEGGAGNANIQVTSVVGAVATLSSFVGAVATNENFWLKVSRLVSSSP